MMAIVAPFIVFLLFAPLIAAVTLTPLPLDTPFPDRREKIALACAIVLIPLASLVVVEADIWDWVVFALFAPPLCVFLTAIAGRRPLFLYPVIVSLLYLLSSGACLVLMRGMDRLLQLASIVENHYIAKFVSVALCSALIASAFLFPIWYSMSKQPEAQQTPPVE